MKSPGVTIVVHRDGVARSSQVRIPRWLARLALVTGLALVVLLAVAVVVYQPVYRAAARVPGLRARIAALEEDSRRVTDLIHRLESAEERYEQLRTMLGGNLALPELPRADVRVRSASEERLYVAPPIFARPPGESRPAAGDQPTVPRRWPLTVPSFRTRGLAEGDPRVETHAGLDLAVPVGSDVRASGGGTVGEAGVDAALGLFVRLQHADEYETVYGHLSRLLVARGDDVREGQVIALSGNSGRSTAPHLHFEIRRRGRSVDPLTMVREGN